MHCFTKRNPEIGYLQGFNFIVDFILTRGFSEEETFWMLVYMIENLLHKQYYSTFYPIFANIKFLKCMLYHLNYKIYKFFVDKNFDTFMFLHKWFLMHFMDVDNKGLISWILDFLFVEKDIATIKSILVIFTRNSSEVFKINKFENLIEYFNQTISDFDDEVKFKSSFRKFFLSKELFDYARELLISKEEGALTTFVYQIYDFRLLFKS